MHICWHELKARDSYFFLFIQIFCVVLLTISVKQITIPENTWQYYENCNTTGFLIRCDSSQEKCSFWNLYTIPESQCLTFIQGQKEYNYSTSPATYVNLFREGMIHECWLEWNCKAVWNYNPDPEGFNRTTYVFFWSLIIVSTGCSFLINTMLWYWATKLWCTEWKERDYVVCGYDPFCCYRRKAHRNVEMTNI